MSFTSAQAAKATLAEAVVFSNTFLDKMRLNVSFILLGTFSLWYCVVCMGKVIAIFSPIGGIGVSTVAAYLAYLLSATSETAIVDMIPDFGSIPDFLGFRPQSSSAKFPVLFGPETPGIADLSLPRRSRLKVFSMPPSTVMEAIDWKAYFNSARKSFANIVVDLPHTFLAPELNIGLAQADLILTVGEYHWATIQALKAFYDCSDEGFLAKCRVVINRSEWLPADVLEECKANLGYEIFAELPYDPSLDGVRKIREHSVFAGALKKVLPDLSEVPS